MLVLCLVEARFPAGTHETYQVPLGAAAGRRGLERARDLRGRRLDRLRRARRPGRGPRAAAPRCAPNREFQSARTSSSSAGRPSAGAGLGGTVDVRPVGVEQSNSSIVFGDELIMKAFRKVEPGVNPELELLRFLTARGFPHIAALAGWYEVEGRHIDARRSGSCRSSWPAPATAGSWRWTSWRPTRRACWTARGARRRDRRAAHRARLATTPTRPSRPTSRPTEALSILYRRRRRADRARLPRPARDRRRPRRSAAAARTCARSSPRSRTSTVGGRVIRTHGDLHLGQTMLVRRAAGWCSTSRASRRGRCPSGA